jgi:outer membrane protein assembly factor BamB
MGDDSPDRLELHAARFTIVKVLSNPQASADVTDSYSNERNSMKSSELVFVGIKGSVVALNRATGQQVWATRLKGSDFVNVTFQSGMLLASCQGEVFCLDPLSGKALWHNPLKGFGIGLATIATEHSAGSSNAPVLGEKRRRDDEAAASGPVAAG